jgi:hypothetical protein
LGFGIKMSVCRTQYFPKVVADEVATALYNKLRDELPWQAGVPSRSGFTRKACALARDDPYFDICMEYLTPILQKLNIPYSILGIYVNFYENGQMYTPMHSHKGTHQLVLSLGATRDLVVGKKTYPQHNGDAIIFGSSSHGVPQSAQTDGRISIATFMVPYNPELVAALEEMANLMQNL